MYGGGDIAGRIGVFASALTNGLTLSQLFVTDLGYYPAFNHPIDITQTGCIVLKNKLDNLVRFISVEDFEKRKDEIDGIISVCPLSVYPNTVIPGSINIPLETLRNSQIPLEKSASIVLYSKSSSGAYIAYRYLQSKGYTNMAVLEGGFEFWHR